MARVAQEILIIPPAIAASIRARRATERNLAGAVGGVAQAKKLHPEEIFSTPPSPAGARKGIVRVRVYQARSGRNFFATLRNSNRLHRDLAERVPNSVPKLHHSATVSL